MSRTSTFSSSLTFLYQVLICGTHILPPLPQHWDTLRALWHRDNSRTRCVRLPSAQILEMRSGRKRPKPRSRRRCLMAKRMSRELCIIKACLTFLKLSKLSWLVGIMMRALWHWENSRTCCQERTPGLQSLPIPVHQSQLGRDCLCLPMGRTWPTI